MTRVVKFIAGSLREIPSRVAEVIEVLDLSRRLHLISALLFWKHYAYRDLASLLQSLESLKNVCRATASFSKWDERQLKELFRRITKTIADCRTIVIVRRDGAHEKQMREIRQLFRTHNSRCADLRRQLTTWRDRWQSQKALAEQLRERASRIPGPPFQKEVSQIDTKFARLHPAPVKRPALAEVNNALSETDSALKAWEKLVTEAEESRSGVETLAAELVTFNRLDVMQDPAGQQTFETIETSIGRIRDAIRAGNYRHAYNILQQNRVRCRDLRFVIARRYEYVRDEMELWYGHPSVANRFNLNRSQMPPKLKPEDVQIWRTLCLEIEEFVNARAVAIRRSNCDALKRRDEQLAISWTEVNDGAKLVQFVTAVAAGYNRLLPGEGPGTR